jgi:alpha-tubulin suppressor-like RCC1 family protein
MTYLTDPGGLPEAVDRHIAELHRHRENDRLANSSIPLRLEGLSSGVAGISVGTLYGCAALTNGSATCWGQNVYGQLGDGTRHTQPIPVTVQRLSDVVQIVASDTHTCALTTGGAAQCWGNNGDGQLGAGVPKGIGSPTPVEVSGI